MNLSERIKLARKKAGLTQSGLAESVGIAQTAISQLESGKTLRSSYLIQIARSCGVNSVWLASGEGEMLSPEDFSTSLSSELEEIMRGEHEDDAALNIALRERLEEVRNASRYVSAGTFLTEEIPYLVELDDPLDPSKTMVEVSVKLHLDLNDEILLKQEVLPQNVVAVAISGNSMAPVLQDGSTVIAHLLENHVVDGRMYVMDHGGQIRVKALYRLPGGGIRVRSYNTAEHPDESYSALEMEEAKIRIIGRVFWGASFY
jgi:phage repressor protein C with HTH and peptisase S24 domain